MVAIEKSGCALEKGEEILKAVKKVGVIKYLWLPSKVYGMKKISAMYIPAYWVSISVVTITSA